MLGGGKLNSFRISYVGLDLWIWLRKCLSKQKSIRLHERHFCPGGKEHKTSEPIIRLGKQGTSCALLVNGQQDSTDLEDTCRFWTHGISLQWPTHRFQRHYAWPTQALVRAGREENLHMVLAWMQVSLGMVFVAFCVIRCLIMNSHLIPDVNAYQLGQLRWLTWGQWYVQAAGWSD